MKQILTRAHDELFRRAPDESFATLPDLWQHCFDSRQRSELLWRHPQDLAAMPAAGRIGLAFKAKDALIEQGYVVEREGRVALRDGRALLDAWAAVYQPPMRRTQLYIMDEVDHAELAVAKWCKRHRTEYGLAEYSGAWRLAPMVRYKQASLCLGESASRDVLAELMKALDAKPVETGSNLVILTTSDESVFFDAREAEGVRVLSPVQLYLDLATQRGRGKEAADELFRRVLQQLVDEAVGIMRSKFATIDRIGPQWQPRSRPSTERTSSRSHAMHMSEWEFCCERSNDLADQLPAGNSS
jgi:hypothetical protein